MGKINLLQTTSLQQTFTFEGTIDVQVVIIEDNPWFVASDVCRVLGLQNPTERLKTTLESDEFLPYVLHRAGQQRTVNVVNESGLYALIFQSRKPIAKKFRKWVTSEVLPAIRKTGKYEAKKASDFGVIDVPYIKERLRRTSTAVKCYIEKHEKETGIKYRGYLTDLSFGFSWLETKTVEINLEHFLSVFHNNLLAGWFLFFQALIWYALILTSP